MDNYVDLVVVKHEGSSKRYLFYAPMCSGLKENDIVIVDTRYGSKRAVVVAVDQMHKSDNLGFLTIALNQPEIKRVLRKVEYKEFNYWEDAINAYSHGYNVSKRNSCTRKCNESGLHTEF